MKLIIKALGWAALLAFILTIADIMKVRAETVLASVDDGRPTRFDGMALHGRIATGARFNGRLFAVAHRTLPLKSCIDVTYRGRTQIAVVNDRGQCLTPWCQRHAPMRIKLRALDMTPALARILRFPGLGNVSFQPTACHNEGTRS